MTKLFDDQSQNKEIADLATNAGVVLTRSSYLTILRLSKKELLA